MSTIATYLDRPIAFQRVFVALGAGITGALLLSQAVYWSRRSGDDTGWFFKTQVEWEEETGLTRREQEGARSRLQSMGLLCEERRGIPAKLFYRVDFEALQTSLDECAKQDCTKPPIKDDANEQTGTHQTAKQDCAKRTNRPAQKRQTKLRKTTTETTAETTSDISSSPALQPSSKAGETEKATEEETAFQAACKHTWAAYNLAFEQRYGVKPVRNQVVNANVKTLVKRLGYEEAPQVAAWYVLSVNEAFVVKNSHGVGVLVNQAESYRTQWARGQAVTATAAQAADKSSANFDAIEEAKRLMQQRKEGGNA